MLPIILGLLVFDAASLLALIWQEKHSASPLIPPTLFREPSVWRADGPAACHGAALVSLITFLPIYLRVARGTSPAETGLLLLPLMFGIGIGSLITGQLVARTGHTAIFPSCGYVAATAGLLFLAFWVPHLSLLVLPWVLAGIALFMGTVMGVVQVTVQAMVGQRMLGTGAATVQFSRSVGAAFGTAAVAAVLFSIFAASDPETVSLFGSMIDRGRRHRRAGAGAAGDRSGRDRPSFPRRLPDGCGLHRHRRRAGLVDAAAAGVEHDPEKACPRTCSEGGGWFSEKIMLQQGIVAVLDEGPTPESNFAGYSGSAAIEMRHLGERRAHEIGALPPARYGRRW